MAGKPKLQCSTQCRYPLKGDTNDSNFLHTHREMGERNNQTDREDRQRLFVGCLTSQQQASVILGWICSNKFMHCHTEVQAADQTFYLTQSQYTDTRLTSPSVDPIMPGAWQGSHWSANVQVTGMTRPGKIPSPAGFEPRIFRSRGGRLNH